MSAILAQYQISYAKQAVIEQDKILGSFLSNQIEVGYFQSEWPYESLNKLTKREDFIFWWVVKEDGTIYRSDNASFIGTNALDYFPQVASIAADDAVYIDSGNQYTIYFKDIKLGQQNWRFWLGSSLESVSSIVNRIVLTVVVALAVIIAILFVVLFLIVKSFTNPVNKILEGTTEISKGNLHYHLNLRAKNELGELAKQFNSMTKNLQKSGDTLKKYSQDLEGKVKERTKELEKKNEELERFNKIAVGRELKMIELKKKIKKLEYVLKNK